MDTRGHLFYIRIIDAFLCFFKLTFICYHMCLMPIFYSNNASKICWSICCSVDAHGRRRVLLCWWTWKGNAFSIVYGSLQIITVIELCKQTYVMYPSLNFDPISTDLRVLTNFQQLESFSAFNSVYNNSGLFGIYAVTVSFSPGA
jgi:hypothetical protein